MFCYGNCFNGCPVEITGDCVVYTGPTLGGTITVVSGDTLNEIIERLDNLIVDHTPFIANSTDSIIGVAGGIYGHSPTYYVRLDPDSNNMITLSSLGLKVLFTDGGDGKIQTDADHPREYLEDLLGPTTNQGITVTPTKINGKIKPVPSINFSVLIEEIGEDEAFCDMIRECHDTTL